MIVVWDELLEGGGTQGCIFPSKHLPQVVYSPPPLLHLFDDTTQLFLTGFTTSPNKAWQAGGGQTHDILGLGFCGLDTQQLTVC